MANWQDAMNRAKERDAIRPGLREFPTVSVYNKQFLQNRQSKVGCIRFKLKEGTYIVANPHTQVEDVAEERVEEVLAQLNIADSDWH